MVAYFKRQNILFLMIGALAGLAVAVFILFAGYNALKDTLSPLLGQAGSVWGLGALVLSLFPFEILA